jgi:hypothetical protein
VVKFRHSSSFTEWRRFVDGDASLRAVAQGADLSNSKRVCVVGETGGNALLQCFEEGTGFFLFTLTITSTGDAVATSVSMSSTAIYVAFLRGFLVDTEEREIVLTKVNEAGTLLWTRPHALEPLADQVGVLVWDSSRLFVVLDRFGSSLVHSYHDEYEGPGLGSSTLSISPPQPTDTSFSGNNLLPWDASLDFTQTGFNFMGYFDQQVDLTSPVHSNDDAVGSAQWVGDVPSGSTDSRSIEYIKEGDGQVNNQWFGTILDVNTGDRVQMSCWIKFVGCPPPRSDSFGFKKHKPVEEVDNSWMVTMPGNTWTFVATVWDYDANYEGEQVRLYVC